MNNKRWAETILFTATLIVLICTQYTALYAQEPRKSKPEYAFISFDRSYPDILRSARNEEYEIKEEETTSRYGKHLLALEKPLKFYSEKIYLFFNENKEIIFFTVMYELYENGSKRIIDKLVSSIQQKFTDEYGESERDTVPYYKQLEGEYELFLRPIYASSTTATVSFKNLQGYDEYQGYYAVEIVREEDEEIKKTLENF
jgi:hypothetical protein